MDSLKTAERLLAEAYHDIYIGYCDVNTLMREVNVTGVEVCAAMIRAVENFSDDYDEEWFCLAASPGIRSQIAWDEIARVVSDLCVDDVLECMFDDE